MKKFILSILILSSMHSRANEVESVKINCWDSIFVGKTSIDVWQNNFSLTQETYDHGVFTTKTLGTGHIVSFYESDMIAVVDLYQGLNKVGTLVAVNSGWESSRLEFKGKFIGLDLSCSIRGN